jgi:hypothetical protein
VRLAPSLSWGFGRLSAYQVNAKAKVLHTCFRNPPAIPTRVNRCSGTDACSEWTNAGPLAAMACRRQNTAAAGERTMERMTESPLAVYQSALERGELAY